MLILAFASARNGNSRIKFFLGGLILMLLMGLKSNTVGNDTQNYIELFNRLAHMSTYIDSTSRFEVGYQLYNKIISLIFEN